MESEGAISCLKKTIRPSVLYQFKRPPSITTIGDLTNSAIANLKFGNTYLE